MIYNFDEIHNRLNSDSYKWHKYGKEVLPLWVADMDFVSPEPVLKALHDRVDHGIFGYAVTPDKLFEIVVERMWDRYQWKISTEDLIFIPGVVTGFNLAANAFASPNGGVLIQTPVYPPFISSADNTGNNLQQMELTRGEDGRYTINFEAFEKAITDETRLFILCNPHNPVGRVFTKEELERMAEICLKHDVVICSDEIHSDLVFSGHHHIPIASLNEEIAQNTVTLIAPSKTFNIAGLDCSVAIIQNPELRQKYETERWSKAGLINNMGFTGALAAYRDGQEWLDQVLTYLEANQDFLYDYLQKEIPEIKMTKNEGTYLAWLDCREAGFEGNPHEFFLNEAKVALNCGSTFGKGGEGFVRLNFGCPRSTLVEALERMKAALRK
jgi:cystathionine beta-lyase